MKVIIYDDSNEEALKLKSALATCFNKLNLESEFSILNDANVDLSFEDVDLIFLDIEIGDDNGISLGHKIRENYPDIPIIITTNYKKYALEGYKIKADRYFLKPINQNELELEIKYLLKDYLLNSKYFYDEKLSFDKIYFKDILYVEVANRKTIIHIKNKRSLESNKSLKEWMDIFDGYGFVQIHRAFFVNLKNIQSFNREELLMINGDMITISKHYRHEFEEAYHKYVIRGI